MRNSAATTVSLIGLDWFRINQNKGKAASVPNVPGALGAKPEPNPNAKKCVKCDVKSLKLGWLSEVLFKMIKAFF